VVPKGYMARAAKLVRDAGGLFIADEVQAGFCRSGRWWGYETGDFVPDIATLGKPMGSGLPLAGVVARGELVDSFRKGSGYFNTFAASPLQAAVGSAVLDVIEREKLQQRVNEVGSYLLDKLRKIECEAIGDVRGDGLFIGIDWVSDRETKTADPQGAIQVVNRLKDKGFLTSNAGSLFNVVKLRPPLIFEREHADGFLAAFEATVRELD
jgi:4-aminobutyrate aminotransferase-like enzyme